MKLTPHSFQHNSRRMTASQPVADQLRQLLSERKATLKATAIDSGVDYQALRRWYVRATEKLDVTVAEKVFKHLTGRSFTDER